MAFEIYADPLADYSWAGQHWVQKLGNVTGIGRLPDHLHEVVFFSTIYTAIYYLSGIISPLLVPQYHKLSPENRVGFDMHVVSHVQAIALCTMSFPLYFSPELTSLASYTPYAGFVTAAAVGYFVWDSVVSIKASKTSGPAFAAHGVAALLTFLQALRPFMLNYAAPFMWFEASTPFVNVNWFASHVPGLVSPRFRLINGLCLLVTFFIVRIVLSPINGYKLFKEALIAPPEYVPRYVVWLVLLCYGTLCLLNFVWFSKMLKIVKRTLSKSKKTA